MSRVNQGTYFRTLQGEASISASGLLRYFRLTTRYAWARRNVQYSRKARPSLGAGLVVPYSSRNAA